MGDALTFPDVEVPQFRLDYSDEQERSKIAHGDQSPLPSGETPGTLNHPQIVSATFGMRFGPLRNGRFIPCSPALNGTCAMVTLEPQRMWSLAGEIGTAVE